MRKILYIIPILLLTLILSSNVYGYTVSGSSINCKDFYDVEQYVIDNPYSNYTTLYTTPYDVSKFNAILNSDLFKEGASKHKYYVMFNNTCIFFDSEFNLKLTVVDQRLVASNSYDMLNVQLKPMVTGNIDYFKYSLKNGTISSTELKTISMTSTSSNLTADYIYSTSNYYSADYILSTIYSNFDVKYTNGKSIIEKKTEFSFVPTYTENYLTCNLKLDIINEPENYTLQYAINSSSSEWREFDNSVGVTVENNCLVIVRMLDENGDEIFANSYNVAILEDMLSTTYFRVNFDNSQKQILGFTPILFNNASEQFDIYFSYNSKSRNEINSGSVAFKDTNNAFTLWNNFSNSVENFLCGNGKTYYLKPNGDAEIVLIFKIVNKHTGITALTRTFKFYLTYDRPEAISSTTNGKNDGIFNTGAGGLSNENILGSNQLDIDWSVDNSTETVKTFFNTGLEFFNLIIAFLSVLPSWLTVPLYTFFMLAIVLFVIKFIRG